MADEARAVSQTPARSPYDAKCLEWEQFLVLGEYPTDTAQRRPSQWQLVYELRPLELIAYWMGIPFRPHHPVYAVIFDPDAPGFYTAPAVKIAELGRPRVVYGAFPLSRLLDASAQVDRALRALVECARSGVDACMRAVVRGVATVSVAHRIRSGVRQ